MAKYELFQYDDFLKDMSTEESVAYMKLDNNQKIAAYQFFMRTEGQHMNYLYLASQIRTN